MENKILLAVGQLLKQKDPIFDEVAFFAQPLTRLSTKHLSKIFGGPISKKPVKAPVQKSFFWEKAVGFLVLATLVIPYCIQNSLPLSAFPGDEDNYLAYEEFEPKYLPKTIILKPFMKEIQKTFWDCTPLSSYKGTKMSEKAIKWNWEDADWYIGFTRDSYVKADKMFKTSWISHQGFYDEINKTVKRAFLVKGVLCFATWNIAINKITVKVSLPPGLIGLEKDLCVWLQYGLYSAQLRDKVFEINEGKGNFCYKFPEIQIGVWKPFQMAYGSLIMPRVALENFSVVENPSHELQFTILGDHPQPFRMWLMENKFPIINYYFCWGTSVFQIKLENQNFPQFKIWHPAIFQMVLNEKCPAAMPQWRAWFHEHEQSQADKNIDVNHQSFVKVLWDETKKGLFKADYDSSKDWWENEERTTISSKSSAA
eukprot:GHVP01011864.1.p1 GENE.GHVP01011864.1~~GHVP01011864.1.p1  ORF type:complete len:441 (-),score=79.89 GHVP01011864.1:1527-2804(-)